MYEEFGSLGSSLSLAMSQSFVVLGCRAWNALHYDMKILPMRSSFVSAVKRMVHGVDASN
jgi:hypothetical protein